MNKIKKLPGVLAFKRAHFITDGAFYSIINGQRKPIEVEKIGIRGTQNIAGKMSDVVNLQQIESAKSHANAEAVEIEFSLGFLDIAKTLHSCNGKDFNEVMLFRKSLKDFLHRAKSSGAIAEISKRYARNVLNGRWLWRNHDVAAEVLITIVWEQIEQIKDYNINQSSLKDFNNYTNEELILADIFTQQLKGEKQSAVKIIGKIIPKQMGAFVLFPSQAFLESTDKVLFKINNQKQAGLRDQKIFNAIKTIDDWYVNDYKDEIGPIPVEAYGSNIEWNMFFRGDSKNKNNAFDLLKILNELQDGKMNEAEALFILSIIERGGVFSESDKVKEDKNSQIIEVKEEEV